MYDNASIRARPESSCECGTVRRCLAECDSYTHVIITDKDLTSRAVTILALPGLQTDHLQIEGEKG